MQNFKHMLVIVKSLLRLILKSKKAYFELKNASFKNTNVEQSWLYPAVIIASTSKFQKL